MSDVLYMADTASVETHYPDFEYPVRAVAGYVPPSSYLSYRPLVAAFYPRLHIFSITPSSSGTAECLDVEKGDASPQDAGPWVRRMIAARIYRPCVYAQASNMPAVIESLRGIPREDYRLWVAAWSADHTVPDGYDAHQFYGTTDGPYDYSVVTPDFFKAVKENDRRHDPREHHAAAPVKAPARAVVHPKVTAAGVGAALATAVQGVLHSLGWLHLTPTEYSAIAGSVAVLAGYVTRS